MGGKNHQPCSKAALESTRLSMHLSSATIQIQRANVRLENTIIDELELEIAQPGQISMMIIDLQTGKMDIGKAIIASKALLAQIQGTNFMDCSDRQKLEQIVKRLCDKGMIHRMFGDMVIEDRTKGGFLTCLATIEAGLHQLDQLIGTLVDNLGTLKSASDTGGLVFSHLEFNSQQSIKPTFARLFNRLDIVSGYFLASAIISTEYFYEVAGFGSLGEPVHHENLKEIFEDFVNGDAIEKLVTAP